MGYTLEALLGTQPFAERLRAGYPYAKIVPLNQGLFMLPLIDALCEELHKKHDASFTQLFAELWNLSPTVAALAAKLSEGTTVAYVEAEFFGGAGDQGTVVWQDQRIILGPLRAPHAINQALRLLGVRAGAHFDEFDAVDLGRHRTTEEWVSNGDEYGG